MYVILIYLDQMSEIVNILIRDDDCLYILCYLFVHSGQGGKYKLHSVTSLLFLRALAYFTTVILFTHNQNKTGYC